MNIENPFKEYKDIHKGQSAIFFGSGPSILNFDRNKITSDILKIGLNDQIFLDLDLDYWFMGDSHHPEPDYFFGRYESYSEYKPKKQKFVRICNWATDQFVEVRGVKVPRNGQLPIDMKHSKYYVADSAGNPDVCMFNDDLSNGHLNAIASITFEALQFILYTGIERLFLVGHDCEYSKGDHSGSQIGKNLNAGYWISKYWCVCEPWIQEKHPNLEIYWIDPKGIQLFNGVSLEDSYDIING
jgi:hypothetical protein